VSEWGSAATSIKLHITYHFISISKSVAKTYINVWTKATVSRTQDSLSRSSYWRTL